MTSISPQERAMLATRIERLQRTSTLGWHGDELLFRNCLPGGRDRRALPDPALLRDPANTYDNRGEWNVWTRVCQDLESTANRNDPRNPQRQMRDMLSGKGTWRQ